MSSSDQQNGAVVKHRACDECRNRKLACTKEPDGCSRCKREGIPCHYSPQKPMGRPRKRPRDDAPLAAEPAPKNTMTELPPTTSDPGMDFLNFITGGTVDWDLPLEAMGPPADSSQPQENGSLWNFGYTGNALGDVSFDVVPDNPQSFSASSGLDPAMFVSLDASIPEPVPALSPPSADTPESSTSSSATPPCCTCMPNLYLALDSMQKLPQDVTAGVRQARMAAKTAYEVVNCPVCCFKMDFPTQCDRALQMQNFQIMMLLATLIPSIVVAYEAILNVVDRETANAQASGRRLIFKLHGLGGIWGVPGDENVCDVSQAFKHREMEPAMWRLTVRALLKVDVYGISGNCSPGQTSDDLLHLGLKDIVALMESKSKARHAFVDALQIAGAWPPSNTHMKMHAPGETPTCQKIIAIAKQSVDQLVIA